MKEGRFSGGVPTRHILAAALRAGSVVDDEGTDRFKLEASYLRLPTEGLFGREDLRAGGELLLELDLLSERNGSLFREQRLNELLQLDVDPASRLLLALFLERSDPLWLRAAASGDGEIAKELIPDQAWSAMESVLTDADERESILLALGNKVDSLVRTEIGLKGEEHVVRACRTELITCGRADLAADVRHVSLISDQLGYDVVAPRVGASLLRLEVKTTSRAITHEVAFFLSRNEASVGVRDEYWRLVFCRIDETGETATIGWCDGSSLRNELPVDTNHGRWMTAHLRLNVDRLSPGLPSLEP